MTKKISIVLVGLFLTGCGTVTWRLPMAVELEPETIEQGTFALSGTCGRTESISANQCEYY